MAAQKPLRSDFSIDTRVVLLAMFDFDRTVELGIQRESSRYRLQREPDNEHDSNAVEVYNSQFKVGYLPKQDAKVIAVMLDNGDVFSIVHRYSSKGDHYDAKYDRGVGDGYYRDLNITVYNETQIAASKGQEVSPEKQASLSNLQKDTTIPQEQKKNSGCLGVLLLFLLPIQAFIVWLLK